MTPIRELVSSVRSEQTGAGRACVLHRTLIHGPPSCPLATRAKIPCGSARCYVTRQPRAGPAPHEEVLPKAAKSRPPEGSAQQTCARQWVCEALSPQPRGGPPRQGRVRPGVNPPSSAGSTGPESSHQARAAQPTLETEGRWGHSQTVDSSVLTSEKLQRF